MVTVLRRVSLAGLLGLVAAPASASPVAIRIQSPQLQRLEREMTNYPISVQQNRVEQEGFACFDPVGVNQLDLQTQIDDLSIATAPQGGRLEATVTMNRIDIRGVVFADGGFPCFDVEETLDPLTLSDVRITIGLDVSAVGGKLALDVLDTATTIGAVSISGSETLADIEETFGLLEGMLPDLIDMAARQGITFANEKIDSMRTGSAFGIPYAATFTKASIGTDGIDVEGSVAPGLATRAACLPVDAQAPLFTALVPSAPALPTALAPDAGVVLSVGGELPGSVLGAAWWAGLLCGEAVLDPPELMKEAVETITGQATGELTIRYFLAKAPIVAVEGDRVAVDIEGMHLEILDPSGVLFGADFGLHVAGTARIDPDTRLVLATFEEASLEISRLESSLVSDEAGRAELQRFLVEDLPVQLVDGMRDMPVADAVFMHPGARILLELVKAEGGFQAALSPFLVPDPEIDDIAPDTMIDAPIDRGWKTTEIRLGATDDRAGPIVYSYSVDDGPWSAWSTESDVMLDLAPGEHVIVAMSRDSWGNVDATPASRTVTREEAIGSCACSTTAGSPAGGVLPIALALLAVAALRRRRHVAVLAPIAAVVVLAPSLARADDTRVMPVGYFSISVSAIQVLNNPPSDVTGTSVDVPTGMFPLGIDAKARESHKMQATLLVPSVVVGLAKNVHGVVYLPIFQQAEVRIEEFEVRAAGINVTGQAQEAMRESGFKSPSGDEEGNPMATWRGSGVGDLGMMVRWRAISTREVAFAFNGGVKLPTGRRDDPRILTDFGFSDGQVDLSLDGSGERRLGQLVVGATAGYRLRLPGEYRTRPMGSPTVTMMRDPGDVMRAGVSSRTSGEGMRPFGFEGSVVIEHHERDHNSAHIDIPGGQHGNAVVLAASANLNNTRWFLKHYKRGRILGLPGSLNVGVQQSFSNDNRNLEVFQASARIDIYL